MSDLLTIAEAAERRGCSENAIDMAIRDGRLVPYDSPGGDDGTRYVWAADVDALDPPRHGNRSKGEPVLTVDEVPGDDEALRKELNHEEIRFIDYCLSFTWSRDRLHITQVPIAQRLIRRFHRLTTTSSEEDA